MSTFRGSAESSSAKVAKVSRNDWPAQVAGRLESATAAVERRTVEPIVGLARLAVYGLLAAMLLMVVGTLSAIALVRVLNVYLFSGADWASFAVTGGILTITGLLLWGMRTKKSVSQ